MHVQQLEEFVGALAKPLAADAVQFAEVSNVLARRQARIEAEAVRQHAESSLRLLRRRRIVARGQTLLITRA